MDKFVIQGPAALEGSIRISGSKNASLPMYAAAILAREQPLVLDNIPRLRDVFTMLEVLGVLGVESNWTDEHTVSLDATGGIAETAPYELVRKMRASVNVLGPLLARLGQARVSLPGGCAIGTRPVDLHLKGLAALGAVIDVEHGYIVARADKLRGARINLLGANGPSRGATANVLMAAVLAEGVTVIEGAAREPETADLCNLLNAMGADIEGIGESTLTIHGVASLNGVEYPVMSDTIEAGTYIAAAGITRSKFVLENCPTAMMEPINSVFTRAGIRLQELDDGRLSVDGTDGLRPVEARTAPWPGFPTDMQAQLMAMCCLAPGISVFTESIYPDRFMHVPELVRLGALITRDTATAIVHGVAGLQGAHVMATDLRASAALVLAGLAAQGETQVLRVYHLDRGYEGMELKLQALGADVRRVSED
ncbi:MAG: UDP-N-acetylglucosamine 1-carboxyvinyltransferase [Candidatus Coatesbacteria bacterium]|nr:UDP-N-acetylglucosamine 1-carboxyvinyltransferase [Candidatus Coatesbacteria bacterium]